MVLDLVDAFRPDLDVVQCQTLIKYLPETGLENNKTIDLHILFLCSYWTRVRDINIEVDVTMAHSGTHVFSQTCWS